MTNDNPRKSLILRFFASLALILGVWFAIWGTVAMIGGPVP